MPTYFPLIRRVVRTVERVVEVAVDGLPDVRTRTRLAAAVRHTVDVLLPVPRRAGGRVAPGPTDVTTRLSTGCRVPTRVTATTATDTAVAGRVAVATDGTPGLPDRLAGSRLGRFRVDWTRHAGATQAVQLQTNGRSDWQDVANAEGRTDGALATIAGAVVGARGGRIAVAYADFTGKDDLTVDSVEVRAYVRQSGTVLNNGDLTVEVLDGAVVVAAETFTGNVDYLTTPRTYVLTPPAVASDLDDVTARVTFTSAVGQTYTAAVDALELVVVGHLEEVPA